MRLLRPLLPRSFVSLYHLSLSLLGALWYRFPARSLVMIGITGTKGKTTVSELIASIFEGAGHSTALSNGVRFKIGAVSEHNLSRMTMPGRFFLQRFLRRAVSAECTHAIVEMTSEGAAQHRHRFLALNALVFTNLAPEHIESHGSFEAYRSAKLSIARALSRSRKPRTVMVANGDDEVNARFFAAARPASPHSFSLKDAEPYEVNAHGISFTLEGCRVNSPLVGIFNLANILAATTLARSLGISTDTIKHAVESLAGVPGRMEYVRDGQPFDVIVDYAHTPDSLRAVYKFLKKKIKGQTLKIKTATQNSKLICVLGATGGGRDKWKRPEMGRIAAENCDFIILTNEDPYDEDPGQILTDIESGIPKTYNLKPNTLLKILDRRLAVRAAIHLAHPDDIIVITGKGSDPSICGPRGAKEPWSDVQVVREELARLLETTRVLE